MMSLKKIRGTDDLYDKNLHVTKKLEEKLHYFSSLYNFSEFRTPVLEYLNLFQRSVGNFSEIVSKQMYTFLDKKQRAIALRPEGTACIARAVLENNLLISTYLPLKYYYLSSMFRYERPQNNRRRQFKQYGIETIGSSSYHYDVEQIILANAILNDLKLTNVTLNINCLGDVSDRKKYNKALKKYFLEHYDVLSDLSKKRLDSNPLRIFDSKEGSDIDVAKSAPSILMYLNALDKNTFGKIKSALNSLNITYKINDRLVRGLDYYTGLVYEFIDTDFDNDNTATIIGGGRYDGLFEILGAPKQVPACGFAIGFDRLFNLVKDNPDFTEDHSLDVFVVDNFYDYKDGSKIDQTIFQKLILIKPWLMNALRYSGFKADTSLDSIKIKKQYALAEHYRTKFIVVLDANTLKEQKILVKNLLNNTSEVIMIEDTIDYLKKIKNEY